MKRLADAVSSAAAIPTVSAAANFQQLAGGGMLMQPFMSSFPYSRSSDGNSLGAYDDHPHSSCNGNSLGTYGDRPYSNSSSSLGAYYDRPYSSSNSLGKYNNSQSTAGVSTAKALATTTIIGTGATTATAIALATTANVRTTAVATPTALAPTSILSSYIERTSSGVVNRIGAGGSNNRRLFSSSSARCRW